MITRDEAETALAGEYVLTGPDEERLGVLQRVFLDDYTGWPSFGTVDLEPDTANETFVALHEADVVGETLQVPYTLGFVRDAPQVVDDQAPTTDEEDALFEYYHVPVEGVVPVVEHLGSVLQSDAAGEIDETPTEDITPD